MSDTAKSAFPVYHGEMTKPDPGMTIREYAAIQMCAGLAANPQWDMSSADSAEWAVKQTDELIERLNQ